LAKRGNGEKEKIFSSFVCVQVAMAAADQTRRNSLSRTHGIESGSKRSSEVLLPTLEGRFFFLRCLSFHLSFLSFFSFLSFKVAFCL
jgi:hypothetical protein